MSNSKIVYFTGICEWAKLNLDNADEKYEQFSITLQMDKAALKEFNALKLKNSIRVGDDGITRVTFNRKMRKQFADELVEFGVPTLYDAEGNEITGDRPLIGNGSEVTIKLVVYGSKMGNGSRLEAVKINKLVTYTPTKIGQPVSGLPF